MVAEGDDAPDFTAPLANGDVSEITFSDRLGDGPVVLVFFPGAFTSVCSSELTEFQERLDAFAALDADVYGISVDTPFALNEFRDQLGLDFDLISDSNRTIVDAYDVSMDFENLGVKNIAKRAVFVVDESGTVTYAWVSDDAGVEPDYEAVEDAVEAAA